MEHLQHFVVKKILDTVWLARYPRPWEIGFDNGGESKGVFSQRCANMGIMKNVLIPWNPQSNAILKRIHQVLQDCLTSLQIRQKGHQQRQRRSV